MSGPPIVCLCGSTRFKEEFEALEKEFTLQGWIVLTVGLFGHADDIALTTEQKGDLDELHLRKIDLAGYVYVVNVGGYIGESTAREIEYARSLGKAVCFLHGHQPKEDANG